MLIVLFVGIAFYANRTVSISVLAFPQARFDAVFATIKFGRSMLFPFALRVANHAMKIAENL